MDGHLLPATPRVPDQTTWRGGGGASSRWTRRNRPCGQCAANFPVTTVILLRRVTKHCALHDAPERTAGVDAEHPSPCRQGPRNVQSQDVENRNQRDTQG